MDSLLRWESLCPAVTGALPNLQKVRASVSSSALSGQATKYKHGSCKAHAPMGAAWPVHPTPGSFSRPPCPAVSSLGTACSAPLITAQRGWLI